MRRLVAAAQSVIMRTDRGPMRSIWRLAYRFAMRGYVAYLRRGEPGSAAYVHGSLSTGEFLHGLSDIDVVIVLAPDPAGPGLARDRVRRRCRRVSRALPVLGDLLFDWPAVFEDADLQDAVAASTLTYRLSRAPGRASSHAVYSGSNSDDDKIRLAERPQLYGPMHDWRLIAGPGRRPPPPTTLDADSRRIAAWLELQYWWQWAFEACVNPGLPHIAHLCVKLIAEPARIWIWLARGERVPSRAEALDRGSVEFPAEAEAFERGRDLLGRLPSQPTAPLAEFLPAFVRLSARVAGELAGQVEPAGSTEVRLKWSDRDPLALPHGGWAPARPTRWDKPAPALLPLVDWRALAMPSLPDETFAPIPGDPGDPGTLAAAALALDRGPYPTLSADRLQIRPVRMTGRRRLRTLQCPATDPVSFALAAGATVACFPEVAGLSVGDTAARAVAEHAVWLAAEGKRDSEALGRLITAARAALLWESVDEGDPELHLTMEATLDALAARGAAAAEAAREGYHEFAVFWRPPPDPLIAALHDAVVALPAYASAPQEAKLPR
ncbi:MAG: nucleotidyltransferase domain-containing protein [Actinomycetota bacterium]